MDRNDLIDRLSDCPPGIFSKVVAYLHLPSGTVDSERSDQATRAAQLVTWAEHTDGPSLKELEKAYQKAIGGRKPLVITVILSIAVTFLMLVVRYLGLFQGVELTAFSFFIKLRPSETVDERFLLITIGESDLVFQKGMRRTGSLSDKAFLQVLQKLENYQPSVIGSIIRHDFEFTEPELARRLKDNKYFVFPCQSGSINDDSIVLPPPGISLEDLGFTDLVREPDDLVRRQLLGMSSSNNPCNTEYSFSLQVALKYLQKKGVSHIQKTKESNVQIGEVVFKRFKHNTGGYQLPLNGADGFQILLNYRSSSFDTVSLRDLLNEPNSRLSELVKSRIILIGLPNTALDSGTQRTPYSLKESPLVIQAHMISQIISAVLDQRPLLSWSQEWIEILAITACSLLGSLLSWRLKFPIAIGVSILLAVIFLPVTGYLFILCQKLWLPLISAAFTLVIATGATGIYPVVTRKFFS